MRLRSLVALVLTATAPVARGQQPQPLGAPDATFPQRFAQVASVRELSDGRVVVSDPTDKLVYLVDFRTGRVAPLTREGSGPGEVRLPLRALALPGDTTVIFDPGNQRYLIIDPSGVPKGEFRAVLRIRGASGGTMMYVDPPRATDAAGHVYIEASRFANPTGSRADSVPILRFDRKTERFDTTGVVALESVGNARPAAGAGGVTMAGPPAFAPRDEWAVFPDGRIAIVRASPFRVDMWSGAGLRIGTPLAWAPVPVGDAEKQLWRDQMAANRPVFSVSQTGGGRGRESQVAVPDPSVWPASLPPFPTGGVWARPNGDLWVLKSRKAADPVPVFDVFDARGARRGAVALPAGTALVGFGRAAAYIVRTGDEGLQTLQRLPLR